MSNTATRVGAQPGNSHRPVLSSSRWLALTSDASTVLVPWAPHWRLATATVPSAKPTGAALLASGTIHAARQRQRWRRWSKTSNGVDANGGIHMTLRSRVEGRLEVVRADLYYTMVALAPRDKGSRQSRRIDPSWHG
jgi:hypothetical protein